MIIRPFRTFASLSALEVCFVMPKTALATPMPEPDRDGDTAVESRMALDAYAHLVASLRRIKVRQARLAKERAEHEATLKAALVGAGADVGTVAGVPACSFKTTLKIALSQKMVKARYPDVAKECSDISEVSTFKLLGE